MNTRILMIASSICMGVAGIVASFAPTEFLSAFNVPCVEPLPVLIQLLGALYCAFAMTNWIAKGSIIGGIYSRPLSVGNLLHFTMGALALAKAEVARDIGGPYVVLLVSYIGFAMAFGYLVFGRGAACVGNSPQD